MTCIHKESILTVKRTLSKALKPAYLHRLLQFLEYILVLVLILECNSLYTAKAEFFSFTDMGNWMLPAQPP